MMIGACLSVAIVLVKIKVEADEHIQFTHRSAVPEPLGFDWEIRREWIKRGSPTMQPDHEA